MDKNEKVKWVQWFLILIGLYVTVSKVQYAYSINRWWPLSTLPLTWLWVIWVYWRLNGARKK
jgi:hypothetical protein